MFTSLIYRLLLTGFCLLLALQGNGQTYYNQTSKFLKANSVWAFGDSIGLNFNTGVPTPFHTKMYTLEGAASVANPATGSLLFYSDGMTCWNAANQIMPNGTDLMGGILTWGGSTTQGVCIVPVIGIPDKYYIFSLNQLGFTPSLFYSVVDMSLNSGSGDVEVANKAIQLNSNSLSEGMIAIPGDNCDIWLLLHKYPEAQFIAYHITAQGIDTVPVVSTAGPSAQWIGSIAVSPNRQLIAMANGYPSASKGVQVAQFNPATGMVSNAVVINSFRSYGVAFSPDNSKLYSSDNVYPYYRVRQYDLSTFTQPAITASATVVGLDSTGGNARYLKLYNDTIYVSGLTGNPHLIDRINKPNLLGTACDYQEYAALPSPEMPGLVIYGLCNDVVFPIPPDTSKSLALDTTLCSGNNTGLNLTLQATPGYTGYLWSNNTTGGSQTINAPGTYWALCIDSCHSRIDSFIVRERNISFSLGNDTLLCDSSATIDLVAFRPGATYLWQDGSTASTCTASSEGTYWVRVSDSGCIAYDTIQVIVEPLKQDLGPDQLFCREIPVQVELKANNPQGSLVTWSTGSHLSSIVVQDTGYYWVNVQHASCNESDTIHIATELCNCIFMMPTAFSPNGDGLNDELKINMAVNCDASAFALSLYNRYGQRVFYSANYDKGWDGNFNGRPEDVGVYFFELHFTGGKNKQHYYQKGDIILIR